MRVQASHWYGLSTETKKRSATDPSPRLRCPRTTSKQRSHIAQSDCHVSLELASANVDTKRKVLHVRTTTSTETVRGDHMSLFWEGGGGGYICRTCCQCRLAQTREKQKAIFHFVRLYLGVRSKQQNQGIYDIQSGEKPGHKTWTISMRNGNW